jgi:uncharacterized membrane protein
MALTPIVLTHAIAAGSAVVVGGTALAARKGTSQHRLLGRTWVVLMLIAVITSFAIKTHGHYSWIHILSIVALTSLAASIFAVVRGNIRAHQRGMRGLYVSLVVAGIFTLLPGRQLGYLVWHAVGLV